MLRWIITLALLVAAAPLLAPAGRSLTGACAESECAAAQACCDELAQVACCPGEAACCCAGEPEAPSENPAPVPRAEREWHGVPATEAPILTRAEPGMPMRLGTGVPGALRAGLTHNQVRALLGNRTT